MTAVAVTRNAAQLLKVPLDEQRLGVLPQRAGVDAAVQSSPIPRPTIRPRARTAMGHHCLLCFT